MPDSAANTPALDSNVDSTPLKIHVHVAEKVNHSAWLNSIPVIKRLSIENLSGEDFSNVKLRLSSTPNFTLPKTWILDRLKANSELELVDRDIQLDPNYLQNLEEAIRGVLQFDLVHADNVIANTNADIRVLAKNEWGGMSSMGDLLPSFVTPNDPAIPAVLKEISKLLEEGGYNSALDGYQSKDRTRAYMLTAAAWSAVSGKKLTYCNPPPSFEREGQKIRSVSTVLNDRLATCLDSALLFASILESIGLHPILIVQSGHCFVGVWLDEKTFVRTIEPDCSEVRKAISSNELIVFETTLVTGSRTVPFDKAIAHSVAALDFERESEFVSAIDVRRARMAKVLPIATAKMVEVESCASDAEETLTIPALPAPPTIAERTDVEQQPTTPEGRIDRWQRKLLDLSLRNSLLNFKAGKRTIPFLAPDIAELENRLADGTKLKIASLDDSRPKGLRDHELHKQRNQEDIDSEYARQALEQQEILCPVETNDLDTRLITLLRSAKSALTEGGANTLFMAVGFLRWKPSNSIGSTYKAPLLLIPVKLERKSVTSSFNLVIHEDEPRFNSTLIQMLKRDFGADITYLESNIPSDGQGVDVAKLLEMVQIAVRHIPGFEVIKEVALAQFSFSKFLMWKDLTERLSMLGENRVVNHLVNSPETRFHIEGLSSRPESKDIDRRYRPGELVHPLPADSSQLSAVMSAAEGHDLVIIGPPGTGKSQTIANIIAQCLSNKKRVLFVAEKTAALDVVHRRLKERGLGDCCVELHSNKADKAHFVEQLFSSWKNRSPESELEWVRATRELEKRRNQLNGYVDALHRREKNGWTPYQAMGYSVKATGKMEPKLLWHSGVAHTQEEYQAFENLLHNIATAVKAIAPEVKIDRLNVSTWTMAWESKLLECCHSIQESISPFKESLCELYSILGIEDLTDVNTSDLKRVVELLQHLQREMLPEE